MAGLTLRAQPPQEQQPIKVSAKGYFSEYTVIDRPVRFTTNPSESTVRVTITTADEFTVTIGTLTRAGTSRPLMRIVPEFSIEYGSEATRKFLRSFAINLWSQVQELGKVGQPS
ncbi:hypothetical protein [Natronoglycomyces albus]|uniref:Uncharacterized protein n=1 Tax=Natronoglycomyces albus TaxID=2811108 RepID=A0A895XQJ7_9ACTN|nr:hypothetical protein [Natronoglycomyces albus]QSB04836.1 hypothetical protein JQS30_13850 [Natronoglycomyces albus]